MGHIKKGIPKGLKEVNNRNEKSVFYPREKQYACLIHWSEKIRKNNVMHDNAQCTNARQCKEITCSYNVWSHKEEWVCAVRLLSTKYSTRIKSKDIPWMSLFARLIGHAKNGWSKSKWSRDNYKPCFLFFIVKTRVAAFITNVL